jgi:hypothetical protein
VTRRGCLISALTAACLLALTGAVGAFAQGQDGTASSQALGARGETSGTEKGCGSGIVGGTQSRGRNKRLGRADRSRGRGRAKRSGHGPKKRGRGRSPKKHCNQQPPPGPLEAPPAPDVTAGDGSALVQVQEGPNPLEHTGVDVYVGTDLTNFRLACSSRNPSHVHECTVPLDNGQRYLFSAAYERDGVLGTRSALVSGWPDSCNPDLFHSPGAWPGSNCWRPFADDSPWNTPVAPGGEDLAAGMDNSKYSSTQSVQALTACESTDAECESRHGLHTIAIGSGESNAPEDFKHAIYYANAGDPYVTLRSRDCATGEPAFSPLDGLQVRIPAEAQPAQGSDHHLTIVVKQTAPEPADTQGRFFEYGLYCASNPPDGTWEDGEVLDFDAGRRVLLDGDGTRAAATAARFPSLGGRIRAVELENGLIRHALFLSAANMDDFGCVYPASPTADPTQDTGTIVYGTRFQLKDEPVAGTDWRTWMSQLGLPGWQRTILTALHDYGGYLGDRTTNGGFVVGFESGIGYTAFGETDRLAGWAGFADDPSTAADGILLNPVNASFELTFDPRVDWSEILRAVRPAQETCSPDDPPVSQASSG